MGNAAPNPHPGIFAAPAIVAAPAVAPSPILAAAPPAIALARSSQVVARNHYTLATHIIAAPSIPYYF